MSDESTGMPAPMRRLHPLSVLFSIGVAARRLLLPGLIVVFVRPGGQYEVWLMVLFVPAVIAALVKYASYRYSPAAEELIVREGIVTRNERHIPYARIQNIDLVQNLLHRALGVAEVRIETASGDRPEAVMRVLSLSAVDEMRRHVFRERTAAVAAGEGERPSVRPPPDPPLVRLGARELILIGLTSNRGLALVAAALGLVWQFDPREQLDLGWIHKRIEAVDLPTGWTSGGTWTTALLAVATVGLALVVLTMLSIVWATLRYHGFTLRGCDDDLRVEYGLLTRISASIPRHRIQQLTIRRGPIERLFGRASVQVETAGHSHDGEGPGVDRLWLAPMVAEQRVVELLRRVMPDVDAEGLEWQPIAARAWRRIFKRGLAGAAAVAGAAAALVGAWAWVVLGAGALFAALHARLYVRHASYALAANAVVYRSGWWARKTSVVRYAKIQTLALQTTPFDRRNRMASVRVDTAGAGKIGHRIDIRYLEAAVAGEMMGRLAAETAVRSFRW